MFDFEIKSMKMDGKVCVAEVLSYRDQQTYTVHDLYGSWLVGDYATKWQPQREAAIISRDLPAVLQERKAKLQAERQRVLASNPFAQAAQVTT